MTHLDELTAELDERLGRSDADLARRYPGDRGVRQPVHTVYVPADRYHVGSVREWGQQAQDVLGLHGRTVMELAEALDMRPSLAEEVYERVRNKLAREPIEDVRIDFEDGFGRRPDGEEDAVAVSAARALVESIGQGAASPYCGIRFKSLEAPTRHRGLRTLDLFVGELAGAGGIPEGFVVTLPKVTSVEQVEAMVTVCDRLEKAHDLAEGSLRFEIQVECPQAIVGADGRALVAPMIHASQGRCTGLHYGTYDYSAACGISAAYQSMEHSVADHAKAVMQAAAASTGVLVSDGSTNVLPVGDRDSIRSAWRLHLRLVRRSLERGFYQGWDLHPGQLPSRFVAVFGFYREGLPAAASRLRAYVEKTESGFLDEPATAIALAGFIQRGVECGAVDVDEARELTGLDERRLQALARPRAFTA